MILVPGHSCRTETSSARVYYTLLASKKMRVFIVASGASVVVGLVVYVLAKAYPESEIALPNRSGSDKSLIERSSERKPSRLVGGLAVAEIARLAQLESDMQQGLSQLDDRLRDVEQGTMDAKKGEAEVEPPPEGMSQRQLGEWLLESSVQSGGRDRERTSAAETQIMDGLQQPQLSGVSLRKVQCFERFCQAEFSGQSGYPPDITPLIGTLPFEGETFAIPDDSSGVLSVFALEVGESIEELRSEAMEEGALRTDPKLTVVDQE